MIGTIQMTGRIRIQIFRFPIGHGKPLRTVRKADFRACDLKTKPEWIRTVEYAKPLSLHILFEKVLIGRRQDHQISRMGGITQTTTNVSRVMICALHERTV
jgi:hypothetical protein